MLVSHVKKFIYLKTVKTAGTSVEIFLEKYCAPEGHEESHLTNEVVSENGIIGARGNNVGSARFRNHMSAMELRTELGEETWEAYTKICVIRNPYDKVVSWFWMHIHPSLRAEIELQGFPRARDIFRSFVLTKPQLPVDRHIYTIGNEPCIDFYLRYENLAGDLHLLQSKLGLENRSELGRFKSQKRMFREIPFREYYDEDSSKVIFDQYNFEFEMFEYDRI